MAISQPYEDLLSDEEPIPNATDYRQVVGSLQYMPLTFLDNQFSVIKFSQFLQSPRPIHWVTLKKVLR